jgi:hypothetical protein
MSLVLRHQPTATTKCGPRGGLRRTGVFFGLVGVAMVLLSSCDSSTDGSSNAIQGNVSGTSGGSSSAPSAKAGLTINAGKMMLKPGDLTFIPSSGPTTDSPNWTTKGICPSGHNASAELVAFNLQGAFESRISLPIEGAGPYKSSPGSGVLDFSLSKVHLYATPDVGPDGTIEVAVGCYADGDALGSAVFVQSIFIHFSDNGATYSTSTTS